MEAPDFKQLAAPLPPDRIEWRIGSTTQDKKRGMALAYIDARDVMERLDEVCGPDGWQNKYSHANGKTVCDIGIKVGDEWIWKADGAGDTDVESVKGALSDAFKRAAVRWGIGRYLYDMGSPWVEIEQRGRSYVIKQSELAKLKGGSGSPASSAPSDTTESPVPDEYQILYDTIKRDLAGSPDAKDLQQVWTGYASDLGDIKANYPALFKRLEEVKDEKKSELNIAKAA